MYYIRPAGSPLVLTQTERPLTDAERRHLESRLAAARRESELALVKAGGASAVVSGALAVATLLASDAPRLVIAGFWTIVWLAFTLWIGLPGRRLMHGQVALFEDALRTGRAREIRVETRRVVEFEEEEDEGACYAFEHEPGASLFIVGQEFYADEEFPNSDFSMVETLGGRGQAIDVTVVKRGSKLAPLRVVPAATKRRLEIPDHLAVVAASVDVIETALPRAAGS